jgi:hypothetical protein
LQDKVDRKLKSQAGEQAKSRKYKGIVCFAIMLFALLPRKYKGSEVERRGGEEI